MNENNYVREFLSAQENKKETSTTKTNLVIDYLLSVINSKRGRLNRPLPSEHALMDKFQCSRTVVIRVYQRLFSIGAIYAVPKRGYFIAENFHNFIKPISFLLHADKIEGEEKYKEIPDWFEGKNIKFINGYKYIEKKFYKNEEHIIDAEIYITANDILKDEILDFSRPLVAILNDKNQVKNMVYELKYEKVEKFGQNQLLVIYFWGYDKIGICIAGKYYVKPEHFIFYHQEFSIHY
ncbi:GntR family transcriptional regulator [Mycoplasma sp. 1654_15]|uniref:GntR family transcriptional regulator n=1 Tax=Mycoplasma sp. 1654_15 TaxID=2725994 RepID=UPI00144904E2|nr:GntR family transcriptional regulator [Mycoplasma sp. 1654_15]QJB71435.1 GntR family transcriptional regulator [Mycoplasma sp. 1654_15]